MPHFAYSVIALTISAATTYPEKQEDFKYNTSVFRGPRQQMYVFPTLGISATFW